MTRKLNTRLYTTLVVAVAAAMTVIFLYRRDLEPIPAPTSACPPETIRVASQGACLALEAVTPQIYGCTQPAGTLQDWAGCASLPVYTGEESQTICLLDARDAKTYRVRRLSDGQCWLIDDLRYGGAQLLGEKDRCSGKNTYDGRTSTTPTGDLGVGTYGACRDSDRPAHHHGYYYNWQAAIQADSGARGEEFSDTRKATGLCPQGWRLPTGGPDGEFAQLGASYQDHQAWTQEIFDASFAGDAIFSGPIYGENLFSYYWSATPLDTLKAYNLFLDPGGSDPVSKHDRYTGFMIRCVQEP